MGGRKLCSGSAGSVINWPPGSGPLLQYFIKERKKIWKEVQYFIKVNYLIAPVWHIRFSISAKCVQGLSESGSGSGLIRNKLASRIRNSGRTDPLIQISQKYLRIRYALGKKNIVDAWIRIFPIPDPGVKKAPDPDPQDWFFCTQKIGYFLLTQHVHEEVVEVAIQDVPRHSVVLVRYLNI